MSALKVKEPGPRYYHFPKEEARGYDMNFFNGLLSEKMTYSKGKWRWEKLPGHKRNEALDCRNYANAAFRALNPNLDDIYAKLKNIVKPQQKLKKILKKQTKKRVNSDDW